MSNPRGIHAESNATPSGFQRSSSYARTPAPVNPTRPDPTRVGGSPTVDPLPIVPSLPKSGVSLTCLQQRLAEVERRQVRDIELIHDYRWKARAARNRILTRQPELERLYEETFGAGWRDELGVAA